MEHAPPQPSMRSLLSQFQTPTDPRRPVGFFGSGCPASCPAELITQSTSDWLILLEPILSIVDGTKGKRWADPLSMPLFGAMSPPAGLHTGRCNPLKRPRLLNSASSCASSPQSLAQLRGNRARVAGEPVKQLDSENNLSHVGGSRLTECQIS